VGRDKDSLFGESVDDDKDGMSSRGWELFYEIHGYGVPGAFGNRKGFEEAIGLMPARLDSAADCAGVAIVLHKVAHAGPGIISVDQLDGLVLAVMAHERMIVLVPEYSELEVVVVWNVKPLVEEEHAILG